jgi:hypothetical protein
VANPGETALLLVCPQAEPAVAGQRTTYDSAAQQGIPAHVTVLYPFKQLDAIDEDDHRRLETIFADLAPFLLRGSRTDWFDDRVLYVAPDDPSPVQDLTARVIAAFPDFPPYRGAFAEVIPHLTVGADRPIEELRAAELDVRSRLPFEQPLDHVELWTGPAVEGLGGPVTWRCLRSYPFRSDHLNA